MKIAEEKWERLVELACVLHEQNDFQEILRVIAQRAANLLRAEAALLLMINPRTRETVKTLMCEGAVRDERKFKALQNQISGWIISMRQPLLSENVTQDPRFTGVSWGEATTASVLGVPLQSDGALLGTLILLGKSGEEKFDEHDLLYLDKLGVIAAPHLRNAQKIAEYFAAPLPEAALLAKYAQVGLIGQSPKFVELLKAIEAAARCEVRVMIEGPTGTGKELVARAIHQFSRRHAQPFVALDCGALPENLIESELFGHVKGAFTGALQERKGLFETAHQGTLFLDEIANLPLHVQTKFLRVLEQNEVRPLGANTSRKVEVRIIAASSRPLRELVRQQLFREDLYYRLLVYPIAAPALDERREDIPVLAEYFLQYYAKQQQKHAEHFHEEVLTYLNQQAWPGNIRQLENFVERVAALAPAANKIIDAESFPAEIKNEIKKYRVEKEEADSRSLALTERVAALEAQLIGQALARHHGNQSQAARQLRVPVQTLQYKMKKLGISAISSR
ncbi:sigma-54-dependent Fis family transcriptional regulator [candidate division KSB1 bacterium]|nr:sigma-54-dependent Fis family transcriptional regulator [candidate division KSB1 bacterium]